VEWWGKGWTMYRLVMMTRAGVDMVVNFRWSRKEYVPIYIPRSGKPNGSKDKTRARVIRHASNRFN
jgi:hypothetical protein